MSFMCVLHAQGHQGGRGGYLFGDAAAGALAAGLFIQQADPALHVEGAAVRVALDVHHLVLGQFAAPRLQEFLQAGLGVLVGVHQGQAVQLVGQPGQHAFAGPLHAAVQVDGADQGFQGVGEDGFTAVAAALQLARPQAQVIAQAEAAGQHGQGLALDQARAQARQLAFAGLREALEQRLAGDEVEDGVAEEFQALVVAPGEAAMGEGQEQQLLVLKGVSELALKAIEWGVHWTLTRNSLSKRTTRSRLPIRGSRFSYCSRAWKYGFSTFTVKAFCRSSWWMPLTCMPLCTWL